MAKTTVADLIDMLEDVTDKSLPVKCICLVPSDNDADQLTSELDYGKLEVDDDGDEVMLTMNFT